MNSQISHYQFANVHIIFRCQIINRRIKIIWEFLLIIKNQIIYKRNIIEKVKANLILTFVKKEIA